MIEMEEEFVQWLPAPQWFQDNRVQLGNLGKHAFYKALAAGDIPNLRLGRKILIRSDALEIMATRVAGTP